MSDVHSTNFYTVADYHIVLWCNGSTLNESDPVKDTFSTKFQSTHKGEDGVRFPGELPFNAAVV